MDDELFKQKLSEVAEWKIPDTPRETSLNAKKKRGRKSNEDEYMELREEIFYEEFGGVNNTYPPMLVKLKHTPTTCGDCGKLCPNGCEKEAKLYQKNGKNYWREKCLTCNLQKDPYTSEFNLNPQKASVVWHSFMRETKGTSMSKGNIAKGLIQNPQEIITFQQDNKPDA